MNRFKRAWLAFINRLPSTVVEVAGKDSERIVVIGDSVRIVYKAMHPYSLHTSASAATCLWHGKYYDSAELAFVASEGKALVTQHKVVATDSGETYLFQASALIRVEK